VRGGVAGERNLELLLRSIARSIVCKQCRNACALGSSRRSEKSTLVHPEDTASHCCRACKNTCLHTRRPGIDQALPHCSGVHTCRRAEGTARWKWHAVSAPCANRSSGREGRGAKETPAAGAAPLALQAPAAGGAGRRSRNEGKQLRARACPSRTEPLPGTREKSQLKPDLEAKGDGFAAQAGSAPNPACCSAGAV
jgi:hypothetical protein